MALLGAPWGSHAGSARRGGGLGWANKTQCHDIVVHGNGIAHTYCDTVGPVVLLGNTQHDDLNAFSLTFTCIIGIRETL